ncbi:MAG: Na(+)/H(+) antiporter subunit C [Brevibacterium aurantiacum]|uniref:Multisubunit sodium/proton antiporter, MrpC subunit n=2 Tax=Brevibacterium aurantiacum TaxID=273384 RepID=A0A2A3ZS95_BREAU|nr:Na(+)/H(+) antiporter subunit C [Brevibacterium aurantiacum]AZL07236.1 Na(+)/H(+) antiporter subunit C [Brevibacterium aurantiacum]AZL10842.1 Na(+)/H(+) antiporter subunit C [Brevibacterium aurantiacum]AZL14455.1 Na(+)/H(+) antiporter subunit C [Brevibacterium aurantiacum]AZT95033.1 Na(+)/H(+) antiporter subunit C [Brevibacterium aurantiacum]MDN5659627.1 Na(+)/H(+) antiporter subunit C [Brevibacterium aurantiacum]
MTVPFIMVLAMAFLFACGIYLMLERSLTRVLLGFILLGNGVNLLIILTAGRGGPPLTDGEDLSTAGMSDPLPQALILTAIVITFAVTAFLLAMIYRSWRLVRADSLQDDTADLQVAITKMIDSEAEASTDYDDTEFGDEAESPITGAIDLDDDGTPREREDPNATVDAERSGPGEAGTTSAREVGEATTSANTNDTNDTGSDGTGTGEKK